jgi:hypothetical protein
MGFSAMLVEEFMLLVFHLLISFNNSSQHQQHNMKTVLNRVVGMISDNRIIFKLVYQQRRKDDYE